MNNLKIPFSSLSLFVLRLLGALKAEDSKERNRCETRQSNFEDNYIDKNMRCRISITIHFCLL